VALVIHRSERADALVSGLGELLAMAPADPFTHDLVAVPSRGVERWITQSLSGSLGARSDDGDGVCANVTFPSPGKLVRDALSAAWGVAADTDPWAEHRLVWSLLDVIDVCATEDWCRTLGRHLGVVDGATQHGRRMAVAQKLAGLFTSYGAQRPGMVRDWRAGHDTDGSGAELDPDHTWQAELWQRLRDHIHVESPAERLDAACDRIRDEPAVVELPERISIFGPTRLTADQLQVVDALADHRDVHLWLPHPSDGLWRHVADADTGVMARRDDSSADLPRHPLVRSCARDAREMQVRMAAAWSRQARPTETARPAETARPVEDEYLPGGAIPETLLGALQRDLHGDQAPTA
jgi:exodeoxyribonuclease V gamma subunit